ncbi:MAG: hypothetical protein WBA12_09100 [Catalinimonas sp.]
MNIQQLDHDLIRILEKRIALSELAYNDAQYDDFEDALHSLEDAFSEEYDPYLETALQYVHNEYCPDSEVLTPIAYVPRRGLKQAGIRNLLPVYEAAGGEGVTVDAPGYGTSDTRMVLLPNPTRLVLMARGVAQQVVWEAE